ncbi:hypothetical protein AAG906_005567 [Vitis piasezkii]
MAVRNFAHHAKPQEAAKEFRTPCEIFLQTTSKDEFSGDEWLGFMFLGVIEAGDIEGRLVEIENPQETELEVCLNIMVFHLKTRIANMNPYSHIKEFEEVCNTFQEGGASIDLMRLQLFPFTLKDKAKIWLNSLRLRSIRTWTDLQAEFLKKYMEAINAYPHHGFDTWLLVSYFYDGMSSPMKQLLETMCGGDFMSKNPEEAMGFLSYVTEVSRGWDEPNAREVGRMKSQPNAKGEMYV